jgi:hypothetical protein
MPSNFVSCEIEDEPGTLAQATRALGKANINIDGLCVAGGRAFFLTGNPAGTERTLRDADIECETTEAIECKVTNRPGELARFCEALAKEGINIDCCYGFASGSSSTVFFATDNARRARTILEGVTSSRSTPIAAR